VGLGLSGAYGASAAADGFRELLKQRIAAKHYADLQQQQQFENGLQTRRLDQTDTDRSDRLAETVREHQAADLDRSVGRASALADQIPSGTVMPGSDPGVAMLQTGGRGSLLTAKGIPTPEAPASLLANDAPPVGDLPGTIASSPTMKGRLFLKGASTKQQNDAALQSDRTADNLRADAALKDRSEQQDWKNSIAQQLADLKGARASQGGGSSLTPAQSFRATKDLQGNWQKAIKPVREIGVHVQKMEQGLEAAKRGDVNAGSQVVINEFNKILDPTSVVRESEFNRTPQGVALMGRLQGIGQRITQGGPGVPIKDLETFVTLAQQMADGMHHFADSDKKRIDSLARRYQIDTADIFDEGDLGTGKAPPPPPAATSSVKIKSITEIK